jgi:hypothetical protein
LELIRKTRIGIRIDLKKTRIGIDSKNWNWNIEIARKKHEFGILNWMTNENSSDFPNFPLGFPRPFAFRTSLNKGTNCWTPGPARPNDKSLHGSLFRRSQNLRTVFG